MSKKLCAWSEKRIKKKPERLIARIESPTHFCRKCTRAANERRTLRGHFSKNMVDWCFTGWASFVAWPTH